MPLIYFQAKTLIINSAGFDLFGNSEKLVHQLIIRIHADLENR